MDTNNQIEINQTNWSIFEEARQDPRAAHYSRIRGRLVTGVEGAITHLIHKVCKFLGL